MEISRKSKRTQPVASSFWLGHMGMPRREILGDFANYTGIAPVVRISEIVVERSEH